jgi:hypothetical protein
VNPVGIRWTGSNVSFLFLKWIDPTLLATKSISNRGSLKIFLLSRLLTDEGQDILQNQV